MKKFRIKEYVELIRTYEVEADDEDEALNLIYGGDVEPVGYDEVHNEMEFETIK